MPKYMFQASYTTEGLKGLFKDGGSKRQEALEDVVKGMGGSAESAWALPLSKAHISNVYHRSANFLFLSSIQRFDTM